jgi:esterase/lipase superfamily enzyme
LQRHYGKLESAALGRGMEHLVFGHAGAPVLVYPTSKGRFHQWEDFGMIAMLSEPLQRGWLQLFCVDSIDELSWYNFDDHQRVQLDWHLAYERYLIEEFLPGLRQWNSTPFLIMTGASFGAFHAVNFALRYPGLVQRVVAMSGDYRSQKYVEGYFDEDVLANSPVDHLGQTSPEDLAPEIRRVEFRLACGRWDFCLEPTQALATELSRLRVPHQCHVWDDPGIHDWPLWKRQVQHYL